MKKAQTLPCILLASFLFCGGLGAQGAQEAKEAKSQGVRRALLVGVGSYFDQELAPLPNTVNDVEALYKKLVEIGFEDENIYLLSTSKTDVRERPNKASILAVVEKLKNESKSEDVLFLAFAGHGFENAPNVYFCAEDTRPDSLPQTGIEIRELLDTLKVCDAKFKWVVIDACRNSRRGVGSRIHVSEKEVPEGVALFQSCSRGESSVESPTGTFGLFTEQLLEAMSKAADENNDGFLTFQEICKYATRKTREVSKRNQNPTLQFDGEFSDFTISRDMNRVTAEKSLVMAQKYRKDKKYTLAKREIDKALKQYPNDEKYLDEQGIIQDYLKLAEDAKKNAEAKRLAEEKAKKAEEEAQRLASMPKPELPELPGLEDTPSTPIIPSAPSVPTSAGRKAGERMTKTVNGVEYAFRWCPAGSFQMGSPSSESGRDDDETQHRVTLTQGFWMLETEVTVGMYRSFVEETGHQSGAGYEGKGGRGYNASTEEWEQNPKYTWKNNGFPQEENHPVANVDWNDAVAFCEWLSRKTKTRIQLPTEAQWEYACRAGTTSSYYFGNAPEGLSKVGNVADGSAKKQFSGWTTIESEDGYVFIAPVGIYRPNAWGLYDMHGNVWEWCSDWYDGSYYDKSPTSDPTGPSSGSDRVIRGGCWHYHAKICRSAFRGSNSPDFRNASLGFRFSLVPSQGR